MLFPETLAPGEWLNGISMSDLHSAWLPEGWGFSKLWVMPYHLWRLPLLNISVLNWAHSPIGDLTVTQAHPWYKNFLYHQEKWYYLVWLALINKCLSSARFSFGDSSFRHNQAPQDQGWENIPNILFQVKGYLIEKMLPGKTPCQSQ